MLWRLVFQRFINKKGNTRLVDIPPKRLKISYVSFLIYKVQIYNEVEMTSISSVNCSP